MGVMVLNISDDQSSSAGIHVRPDVVLEALNCHGRAMQVAELMEETRMGEEDVLLSIEVLEFENRIRTYEDSGVLFAEIPEVLNA